MIVETVCDSAMPPISGSHALSVILPASNEEALIGDCLSGILASEWEASLPIEVVVVANGCRDATAERARSFAPQFKARGWDLVVLDLAEGGKLNALNQGDATARAGIRAYLDADVVISPPLLTQLYQALSTNSPRYASGKVVIPRPSSVASRAYKRIYEQVPFMTHGVPGCGLFAVNAEGRKRWGSFPKIISDDTFVRLSFTPEERIGVPASYTWPIVEGFATLVKVRRRQDAGVTEIKEIYPALLENDDKPPFPTSQKLAMALKDPFGFAVYSGVALTVKLTKNASTGWSRGR
jgi:glycosyltransferase involved in cell wall biosynthesis